MGSTALPHPIYLDCDTGIDDSLALAYLLATDRADLVGVGTVAGNTSARQGADNDLRLLALAGRNDIPVAVGARDFLAAPFAGGPTHVHGDNGIGNIDLPAAVQEPDPVAASELLLRLSHQHAGRLRVVAVGPLTNLALALEQDPTLTERVASVTVMGGAAGVPGNVSPVAEANVWHDPEAAQRVLAAPWDVTLVPLDVTMENILSEDHRLQLLQSGNPVAEALGRMLDFYFDFYVAEYGERCSALHDPLAAAISVGGIVPTRAPAVPIMVDTTVGPGRGQTICDLRGQRLAPRDHDAARSRVVLGTDRPLAEHLLDVILGRDRCSG